MANFVLVDSDILIDFSRGKTEAAGCLQELGRKYMLAASVVTQMELLVGCRDKAELRDTEKFIQRFLLLKLTEPISDHAVDLLRQYNLSHGLLMPDALIAATALEYGAPFITKNQRDYRFINGLNLLAYP